VPGDGLELSLDMRMRCRPKFSLDIAPAVVPVTLDAMVMPSLVYLLR
jgi:hypothetical protein